MVNGRGQWVWLYYQVARLMYCFHESLPASLPPPVAFSPPNEWAETCVAVATVVRIKARENLPTKCPANLGSTSWNIHIHYATIGASWSIKFI